MPSLTREEMTNHLKIIYSTGNLDILYQHMTGYAMCERPACAQAAVQTEGETYPGLTGLLDTANGVKGEQSEESGKESVLTEFWNVGNSIESGQEKSYECDECGKLFVRRDHLKRHMLKLHGDVYHRKTSSFASISRTKLDNKEEEFYCNECGKNFTRKDHLKRHKLTHSGEKPFSCEYCEGRFTRADALMQHKLSCQVKNETPAEVLKVVGKPEGKTLDKLSKVLFGKVVEFIWGCRICYAVFETEQDLDLHRAETHCDTGLQHGQHWNPVNQKYTCPVCEKVLKTKHLIWFIYHMEKCRRGEGSCLPGEVDSFLCHICSKPFTSKQTLNMHVNYVHTTDRPFSCRLCNKSYKIKSELTQHELTHSDHCNYSCETCGKQFRGKVNLRMHMKTHLSDSEKKHVCSMCGHRFARLQHLRSSVSFIRCAGLELLALASTPVNRSRSLQN